MHEHTFRRNRLIFYFFQVNLFEVVFPTQKEKNAECRNCLRPYISGPVLLSNVMQRLINTYFMFALMLYVDTAAAMMDVSNLMTVYKLYCIR